MSLFVWPGLRIPIHVLRSTIKAHKSWNLGINWNIFSVASCTTGLVFLLRGPRSLEVGQRCQRTLLHIADEYEYPPEDPRRSLAHDLIPQCHKLVS